MTPKLRLAALGLLVAGTLAGCGGDDGSGGDKADGGGGDDGPALDGVVVVDGAQADVKVLDNSFNDKNIQVAPGTKVVWTNDGRQDHDVVPAEDGEGAEGFGVEPDGFGPDAVYEFTFEEPGTYRYFCSLHGTAVAGMVGAVVVQEEDQ
jgi:plastocyanin